MTRTSAIQPGPAPKRKEKKRLTVLYECPRPKVDEKYEVSDILRMENNLAQ